jgi:hypothetical protein
MLIEHQHKPGEFDPGHCRVCARATGLLDHYCRVQGEEQALTETRWWVGQAGRRASWALWSSGIGIVLGVVALLTG